MKAKVVKVDNSKLSNTRDDSEIVVKHGFKTRKRTSEDYERLWDFFERFHAKKFEKQFGFGKKKIKEIGIEKFIDTCDWLFEEDIEKTMNQDVVKVLLCSECQSDFALFPLDYALCPECQKKYDMQKFFDYVVDVNSREGYSEGALVTVFSFVKEFRDEFLLSQ